MNVDCWEKIFDLLSLRDILAMSGTCQRMRQIGGHYFHENFHGTVCCLDALGPNFCANRIRIDFEPNDFLRFVDTVEIHNEIEDLRTVSSIDLLTSLTTLRLFDVILNKTQLLGFENIQTNIETVDLNYCYIEDDSVGEFLVSCSKLKCLRFDGVNFNSTAAKSSSFQRTYPMLEYFQCTFCRDTALELPSFLERNPTMKSLRIIDDDLCEIPHNKLVIQLDCLNILICSDEDHSVQLANRLKTIHSNGWYNKLRVSIWIDQSAEETFINEMASFSALEALFTFRYNANICHFTGLKELHFRILPDEIDLESIAVSLTNLERLWISGSINHLLPFLRHSKSLKMAILDDRGVPDDALNLLTMNKMRQMGGLKCKIRIGVFEKQYLATKWNRNILTCGLVEIIRAETIREFFDYKDYHLESYLT